MRARNLKPSLFTNELLGFADPLYTIIFEGLWCAADREGRLEDRPARIHIKINPGRPYEGTERALNWLEENGFIQRYQTDGVSYIHVSEFLKHQNPHSKEVASTLPAPPKHRPRSVPGSDKHQPRSVPARLIPSSLIPDSGIPHPESPILNPEISRAAKTQPMGDSNFEYLQSIYPKRAGSHRWQDARKHVNARLSEGHTWTEIHEGVKRYAAFIRSTHKERTEHVQQAATFLGTNKSFLEPWSTPATKADTRLDANLEAADEFMRMTEPTT